jgi:hypothetical protein
MRVGGAPRPIVEEKQKTLRAVNGGPQEERTGELASQLTSGKQWAAVGWTNGTGAPLYRRALGGAKR